MKNCPENPEAFVRFSGCPNLAEILQKSEFRTCSRIDVYFQRTIQIKQNGSSSFIFFEKWKKTYSRSIQFDRENSHHYFDGKRPLRRLHFEMSKKLKVSGFAFIPSSYFHNTK